MKRTQRVKDGLRVYVGGKEVLKRREEANAKEVKLRWCKQYGTTTRIGQCGGREADIQYWYLAWNEILWIGKLINTNTSCSSKEKSREQE
jgi:hypothetical protein